jgi:hypothetical protein
MFCRNYALPCVPNRCQEVKYTSIVPYTHISNRSYLRAYARLCDDMMFVKLTMPGMNSRQAIFWFGILIMTAE